MATVSATLGWRHGAAAPALLASIVSGAFAQTQSLATEVALTTGFSSEKAVSAAAGQVRVSGETVSRIQFNVEGIWADRTSDDTDAFGAAYPYGGRLQVGEAYAERLFHRGRALVGVRAGQFRSPFGISNRSDHAYGGFTRAPLTRYDGYWAVTNTFLERGVDVVAGTSWLSVEARVGVPGDLGTARRRSGIAEVVRVQSHIGAIVVGASHIGSRPYRLEAMAPGRMRFTGVDARWMQSGVQLRGEWMVGQPWDGPRTNGFYLDALVHRPFMGPVTAIFRTERLRFDSPLPFPWGNEGELHDLWLGGRHTVGGRVRLPAGFTAQMALIRQSGEMAEYTRGSVLDLSLTSSVRRH